MSFVVFDIETGPLPIERLKEIHPGFDRSTVKHPGEFDPASVKCGNIGGPTSEKGMAKIAEARAAHEKELASFESTVAQAETNHWLEIKSRAALSAASGQVLAIGMKDSEQSRAWTWGNDTLTDTEVGVVNECSLLRAFWIKYESCRRNDVSLVGFNSREFDIPFLAQRSVILGVAVPKTLIQNERYQDKTFIDLRDRWGFGAKPSGSLDLICKACGLDCKPDGVSGAHFSELYHNPDTRQEAIDYLLNDLDITYELAERLLL